jgi:hypothetical protein
MVAGGDIYPPHPSTHPTNITAGKARLCLAAEITSADAAARSVCFDKKTAQRHGEGLQPVTTLPASSDHGILAVRTVCMHMHAQHYQNMRVMRWLRGPTYCDAQRTHLVMVQLANERRPVQCCKQTLHATNTGHTSTHHTTSKLYTYGAYSNDKLTCTVCMHCCTPVLCLRGA